MVPPGSKSRPGRETIAAMKRSRGDEAVLLGLTLFLAWSLRHVFAPGPLLGWDSVGHLLKVEHVRTALMPYGAADGWFPYWHCGFQLFQFYPPAFYWITAAVACLTGSVVALKLTTLASVLALPPAVYWMLRELGLRRAGALAGAVFSAFVSSSSGGIPGTFVVGLLPGALGLALVPVVVASYHRAQRLATPRATLLAGSALAVIVLCHAYSAYFAALAVVLATAGGLRRDRMRQTLRVAATVAAWASGLTAFWLVPLLRKYAYRGVAGSWSIDPPGARFMQHLLGGLVADGLVTALGWAGLLLAIVLGRPGYRLLALLAATAFGLAGGAINEHLPFAELVGSNRMIRFEPALGIAWAALGGIAVAEALALADRWPAERGRLRVAALALLAAALLAVSVPAFRESVDWSVRVEADYPRLAEVRQAAEWIRTHVPPNARLLGEIDWAQAELLGTPHVLDQYVPLLAQRMQLGGNFGEGSPVSRHTLRLPEILEQPEPDFESWLRRFGTGYAVTMTRPASLVLRRRAGWDWVYRSSLVNVFAMREPPALIQPREGAVLQDLAGSGTGLVGRIETTGPQPVTVAVTYTPNWRATLDGADVPVRADDVGLVVIAVPSGGPHTLGLRYRWAAWESALRGLSAAVAAAAAVSWLRGRSA